MKKLLTITIITLFVCQFSFSTNNVETAKKLFNKMIKTKNKVLKKQLIKKIIKIAPNSEYGFYSKAVILFLKNKFSKALKMINQAINLNKKFVHAYYIRALLYIYFEKYSKMIKDCNIAIKIQPSNSKAYGLRGYAFFKLEKYKKAIKDFTLFLKEKPKSWDAWFYRGLSYYELGNFKKALKDLVIALKLKPENNKLKKLIKQIRFIIKISRNIRPATYIRNIRGVYKVNIKLSKMYLKKKKIRGIFSLFTSLGIEKLKFIDREFVHTFATSNISNLTYKYFIKRGRVFINLLNQGYITLIIVNKNILIGEGMLKGLIYIKN